MARMSDQELQELKNRAQAALGNGSHLARSEEHLVELIDEVLSHRNEKLGKLREALDEGAKSPVASDYSLKKVMEKVEHEAPHHAPPEEEHDHEASKPTKKRK